MKIAVTGSNGRVGKCVVKLALQRGHTVVGVDYSPRAENAFDNHPKFIFTQADLKDYEETKRVLAGVEGVIQLAAFPDPGDYGVTTHNSNVVISWNILRSCAELGINRVAQASSVNVITMAFAQKCDFHYFPINEEHSCNPDEPYGLSKQIAELQAASIVRRYPSMRVASIRLHWSVPHRDVANYEDPARRFNDLWGYVQEDSGADAFLLAVTSEIGWSGHEAFVIASPTLASNLNNETLRKQFFPNVPIKDAKFLKGKAGFFDCGKAKRLLGWVHSDDICSDGKLGQPDTEEAVLPRRTYQGFGCRIT
ncbi:hypothetical protein H0H87_007984 [Tephrocybe sp. NHM501043]|nr:hypothetical protein H0H87_007984 [Tephrocybe sp. NHM501043]